MKLDVQTIVSKWTAITDTFNEQAMFYTDKRLSNDNVRDFIIIYL